MQTHDELAKQAASVLAVIPTLGDRIAYLEETLASLKAQHPVVAEIIIVTPRTNSELDQLAQKYRASVLQEKGHIAKAINRGFSAPIGKHQYALWIGDDDTLPSGAIAAGITALESRPDAVFSYGACEFINNLGERIFTRRPPPFSLWLMQIVPGLIKSESCLFRIDALNAAGGLDESLRYAMDLDLILKLRKIGPGVRCRRPTGQFRVHHSSITHRHRKSSFKEAQEIQQRLADRMLLPFLVLTQPILLRLFLWRAKKIRESVLNA